jgi:F-type H+-transporting ATPase subunit a
MSTSPLDHVVQHPLKELPADVGPLTPEGVITLMSDHIAMILLAGVLLCVGIPWALRRSRLRGRGVERMVTTGFAGVVEVICQYLRTEVAEPASVFFFVLTMNLLGLIPLGSITPLATGFHIGGTATSNIWVTGTMAVTTLVMMVVNGIRLAGFKHFLEHLCPGPLWLAGILVPVELVGLLAKTFALAVRLFANMVAGHVLLAVLLSFILSAGAGGGAGLGFAIAVPVILGSVAISMLEIFVAFLQAFIFTFLTTLFIGMMVTVDHGEHHEEAHA